MPSRQETCRIAIVVLNYNGLSLLKQYLPALLRYSEGNQIIVVDNGSTDGSVAYIEKHFATISCIVHATNYGVAQGYNYALSKLTTRYYLLVNNDLLATPGWLSAPLALMESDASIAFCQPKILSLSRPEYFDYSGAGGGFIDRNGYPFCRGRIFHTLEQDHNQYDDTRPVFWASGACLWVRAQAFHSLGGFDEIFFAHFEEIDLCWRAQIAGWKVYYCGASTVYHLGSATLSIDNPQKTYLNFRNRALMLYKYLPKRSFRRIGLDLLAACHMFFLGKPAHAWAILRAQIAYLRMKRKRIIYPNTYTPFPNYEGNLLIDYFIKSKRIFSSLTPYKFKI